MSKKSPTRKQFEWNMISKRNVQMDVMMCVDMCYLCESPSQHKKSFINFKSFFYCVINRNEEHYSSKKKKPDKRDEH